MITPIPDHVQAALDRLITQYKGATNLQGIITAIVKPLNDLEAGIQEMDTLRYLPDAVGAQLDLIGRIVGIEREPGQSDGDYLLRIYAQIKINTSEGQPEQAIQVFQLFTGAAQVRLFEMFPARVQIQSAYSPPDQATADVIINAVDRTLPAGVATEGFVSYDPSVPFGYQGILMPNAGYGTGKYATLHKHRFRFGYGGGTNDKLRGYGAPNDQIVGGSYTP